MRRTATSSERAAGWSRRALMGALLPVAVLLVVACAPVLSPAPPPSGGSPAPSVGASPGASPDASPGGTPSPSASLPPAAIPLAPASPGANPVDLFAWLFTPIFWVLFNLLVIFDKLTGNIAIAIALLTVLLRIVLIGPFRAQTVQTRRMQLVQPELRELQKRYKGDRTKLMAAQQQFYKERGVSPTAGCLPLLLQFGLLIPMYSVIQQGLTNFDPQAMTPIPLGCDAVPIIDPAHPDRVLNPCLNPIAFGVNWGIPEILFYIPILTPPGFGVSLLAIISALVQLVASRMTLPPADPTNPDPNVRIQRQMILFLPLISVLYGAILPAGLFIYWILGTVLQIIQQYLIVGWGSMFPIFGWTPGFAEDHTPRFPVSVPPPKPAEDGKPSISSSVDRATSVSSTIRPRQRGRQGRRGRRR
jgi:YidC/Oxa1 family membrane protein insertase